MVAGRCLFIDDATLISPKVLAVVYPALDGRRQIAVKAHKGEIITAASGFYVIAGHNSLWTELPEFPKPPAGRSSGSWMVRSHWPRGTLRRCRSRRLAAFARAPMSGSLGSCSILRASVSMPSRCTFAIFRPLAVQRRRCADTLSISCAGSDSSGRSTLPGIERSGPRHGTSAAGWRRSTSRCGVPGMWRPAR